jgi:hypothetical protein
VLREELDQAENDAGSSLKKAQLTKRECVFVLLQMLSHLGGEKRLYEFALSNGWSKLMPAQRNAKVGFLRNKILHDITEGQVHEKLLNEACLCAGYSAEPFPALRFERNRQTEMAARTKPVE